MSYLLIENDSGENIKTDVTPLDKYDIIQICMAYYPDSLDEIKIALKSGAEPLSLALPSTLTHVLIDRLSTKQILEGNWSKFIKHLCENGKTHKYTLCFDE